MELLSRLGWSDASWKHLALMLLAGFTLGLSLLARYLLRPPTSTDPALSAYQRFCRKLRRRGLARAPAEGPLQYAHRVSSALPQTAAQVSGITRRYIALRYGARPDAACLSELRRLVRIFRP
jgi:protein-glutamine gamma-glutamyltransferase